MKITERQKSQEHKVNINNVNRGYPVKPLAGQGASCPPCSRIDVFGSKFCDVTEDPIIRGTICRLQYVGVYNFSTEFNCYPRIVVN